MRRTTSCSTWSIGICADTREAGEAVVLARMFTSILCPVDFSSRLGRVRCARRSRWPERAAPLTLLHVTDSLLDAAARAAGTEDTIAEQTQDELGRC